MVNSGHMGFTCCSHAFHRACPSSVSHIQNIMHKGDGFSAKLILEKAFFIAKMSGLAMVWPVLTFGKHPYFMELMKLLTFC